MKKRRRTGPQSVRIVTREDLDPDYRDIPTEDIRLHHLKVESQAGDVVALAYGERKQRLLKYPGPFK